MNILNVAHALIGNNIPICFTDIQRLCSFSQIISLWSIWAKICHSFSPLRPIRSKCSAFFFSDQISQINLILLGTVDNGVLPCVDNSSLCTRKLQSVVFTEAPLFYKRTCSSLARPLVLLFTQLLSVSFVPDTWKTATVTPVFKKGLSLMLPTTGLFL